MLDLAVLKYMCKSSSYFASHKTPNQSVQSFCVSISTIITLSILYAYLNTAMYGAFFVILP